MKTYKKGNQSIRAVQFDWTTDQLLELLTQGLQVHSWRSLPTSGIVVALTIKTLDGNHIVKEGDYIIEGKLGGFYSCNQELFEKTYLT